MEFPVVQNGPGQCRADAGKAFQICFSGPVRIDGHGQELELSAAHSRRAEPAGAMGSNAGDFVSRLQRTYQGQAAVRKTCSGQLGDLAPPTDHQAVWLDLDGGFASLDGHRDALRPWLGESSQSLPCGDQEQSRSSGFHGPDRPDCPAEENGPKCLEAALCPADRSDGGLSRRGGGLCFAVVSSHVLCLKVSRFVFAGDCVTCLVVGQG